MSDPADNPAAPRRATVVGTGLIGGSIGLALRRVGWHVTGVDRDEARAFRALDVGAIDAVGYDADADLTVVATPVGQISTAVAEALGQTRGVVTDVGGVKASVVAAIDDPRFVGGHPMAGSEQDGIEGATADLFDGAVWVLTPVDGTDPDAFTLVRSTIAALGAEVVEVSPERHDELVAVVSHVPHLTAAALMGLASSRAQEQGGLLRLAAGGFRDMTRIASGHPGIWPDVCESNRPAIVAALDELVSSLGSLRDIVDASDRPRLIQALDAARRARNTLPARSSRPEELVEVRVPIRDQPGELSGVTTLATDLEVNIYDIEIDHSAESTRGLLVLVVAAEMGERLLGGLMARGYRPTISALG